MRNISLTLPSGIHYLIGLNGSGKTTLLKCLAGLIPFDGEIWVNDLPVHESRPGTLARQIAFVPQQLNISFRIPVYDFILTGRFPWLAWLGNYSARDHNAVKEWIDRLELNSLSGRYLDQISGGELQKVMLARAMVQETPLLLLDEPAQSLDPKNKAFLYDFLRKTAAKEKTIVCTTHDLEPLEDVSARIVGLKNGEIILERTGGLTAQEAMELVY